MALKIPSIPSLGAGKPFARLKPLRLPYGIIPYGGTFHWELCHPKQWESAKSWFPFNENNDILITSYPKCGHHLTQKLCLEIIKTNNKGKYTPDLFKTADMGINTTPPLEYYVSHCDRQDIEERINLTNDMYPRIWFTHHSFDNIPLKSIKPTNKIITMIRNPKDCIVSLYFFGNRVLKQIGKADEEAENTVDDMISYMMRGVVAWGCYFKWYESYWNAMNNNQCKILWLYYEDFVDNPLDTIKKMSNFIFDGEHETNEPHKVCNISDDEYQQIVDRTRFDAVRKDVADNPQSFELGDILFRKGINYDWKNHLNDHQSELIDETMYFKWAENASKIKYYQEIMDSFNERSNQNYFS